MGSKNQGTGRIPVERVRRQANRNVQKGELLRLPGSLRVEVLLEPANDLDDRPRTGAVKPDDERAPVPPPSNVFAAEPAVNQSAQVSRRRRDLT